MIVFRGALYIEARKPDLVEEAQFENYLKEVLTNVQKADRRVEQLADQLPRSAKLVRALRDKFSDMWTAELAQWDRYANAHAQVGQNIRRTAEQLGKTLDYMQRIGKGMDMLMTQSYRFTKRKMTDRELALIDEISQLTGASLVTL